MADSDESPVVSSTFSEAEGEGSVLDYIHDSDSSSRLAAAPTLVPSDSASQTSSTCTLTLPVPTNTPESRSAINDTNIATQLNELTLAAAQVVLLQLPGVIQAPRSSSPPSESSISEGKPRLRGPFRSELDIHKQLFKAPPPRSVQPPKQKKYMARPIPNTPTTEMLGPPPPSTNANVKTEANVRSDGTVSPPNEHVHELGMWVQYAKEDMDRGLKRLQQAAEDTWRTDRSKSVEQWYSEMLADVIKKQDTEFDVKCLQ